MPYSIYRIILCLGLVAGTSAVHAEEVLTRPAADHRGTFTLALENDIVTGNDDNYTNGVRLAFISAENNIPTWFDNAVSALPFFSYVGHKRWGFEIGQNMYTPDDITLPIPDPTDRPYAGWLYGSFSAFSDTGSKLDQLQITLGMVGPASGAAESQRFVHDIIDSDEPMGWGSQLKNEPGLVVTYERKWRSLYEFQPFGWGFDITPSLGGSVGNIYTHASAGAIARFGFDLPSDYGPPLVRPNLTGSDFFVPQNDFGWYLFGGFEGRAVARNIFLDGNTWRDSPSVDKETLVGGLQAGIAFTIDDVRLAYTHVWRTREFEGQDDPDAYGAITMSFRF